jgi:hypothetical protein
MAENNWSLLDGRGFLVEFSAAQPTANWGWFGARGGDSLEFATPTAAWNLHAWLRGGQFIAATDGIPPVTSSLLTRTLMGIGV